MNRVNLSIAICRIKSSKNKLYSHISSPFANRYNDTKQASRLVDHNVQIKRSCTGFYCNLQADIKAFSVGLVYFTLHFLIKFF